jgi:putative heme-binding domain-containing protein
VLREIVREQLLSPAVLLPAFPKSPSTETAQAVLDYLADAIRGGWHPQEEELAKLLNAFPEETRAEGKKVIHLLREQTKSQRAVLAELEEFISGGDVKRGRVVFFGKKVACAACHRIGDEGGDIGPDLTKVGAIRSGRDLLESIVLPSSTFAQGYETYAAVTRTGRIFTGVKSRQTSEALTLRGPGGAEVRIPTSSVESVIRQSASLMPDGLARALTPEELGDLLAFLQSLR